MIRDSRSDQFLIDHALRRHARHRADHAALIDGQRRLSYAELDAAADGWAALFAARGVTRGDRVLLVLENGADAVAGFYGTLRADAVPSILNAGRQVKRLERIVARAEPRLIVTNARLAEAVKAIAGDKAAVVIADDPATQQLVAGGAAAAPPRRSIELDLATICWTTGSTGDPKGVMLTHQNMRNSATAIAAYLDHGPDDVVLCVLPLSHTYGLFQLLVTHWTGGTLVLERGFALPFPILKRMVDLRVTGFAGVPTMYASILALKDVEKLDLSGLRYLTNAGYALPAPHLLRLRELFPRARLFAMYGQTECTRVCYLPPDQSLARPSSVGISMPNQEVWIEKEDGTRAGPGEVGELVVRGPNVMRGYWRDPEATARALRPGAFPGEVVLHTGDLFRTDDDGYLYFVARADDVIKTRGEKVAPREVEQAICGLADVVEAAVVGIPDPIHGVSVKAVVVRRSGSSVSADDIKRAVFAELDEVAVPRVIEFVDALPKSDGGKVLKSELV